MKKEPKVKGGSRIEVRSAGFKAGNNAQILLNGDQVMTIKNQFSKIKMQEATMSSVHPATNMDLNTNAALPLSEKPRYFHTKCTKSEWWSALFPSKYKVFSVKI